MFISFQIYFNSFNLNFANFFLNILILKMNQDKVNIDNSMTIKFEDTVMVKQEEPKSPKECKQQFTSLCKIIKENGELKSNLEETKSLLLENIRNQMKLIKENGELKVKLKRLESVAHQNCRLKTKFCKVANIVNMVNIELEDYKGKVCDKQST